VVGAAVRHIIIADAAGNRLGYAILRGIGDPDPHIELMSWWQASADEAPDALRSGC
jgi:hypothetical protein